MRTPFVLVPTPLDGAAAGTAVPLPDDARHHLARVLRRAPGDEVVLADGAGWTAPATLADGTAATTAPAVHEPPEVPSVTVLHAVPKGRALDEVVRTCTELGVAAVVPVTTERSVVRLRGDRAAGARARWQAVADAAAAQARRARRCVVHPVEELLAAVDAVEAAALRLAAHPSADAGLGGAVRGAAPTRVALAVGPEGGFTDAEVRAVEERGWQAVRAGGSVLRTAHAAPVLVAAVQALAGRFDEG